MTGNEWLSVVGGVAVILWINWYFFLATRERVVVPAVAAGAGRPDEVPEVVVTVKGGYEPAAVRVPSGRPVRLVFDRQETSGCSEEVVIPEFGIRRFLPAFQKTAVEITPQRAGTFDFTCGMSMLRGKLTVEE